MRTPGTTVVWLSAALLLGQVCNVLAGKVILNIKAVNASDKPQTRQISQPLPPGLGTNDIISLDGMELRHNSASNVYFVWAEQELGPKQSASFEVEVKDIWIIPAEELEQMQRHASSLLGKLAGSRHAARGEMLEAAITNALVRIARNAGENEAARVGAERHMAAFAMNNKELQSVKSLIAELEDVVAGTGADPGRPVPLKRSVGAAAAGAERGDALRIATFRVVIVNLSSNESRNVSVDLPPEVGIADVIDTGGLQLRPDPEKGICRLFKDGVELKPNEMATYNVAIRDRWNTNSNRIDRLKARIIDDWERSRDLRQSQLIRSYLTEVVAGLKKVVDEVGPESLDQRYIDFYRNQSKNLGIVEEALDGVERMMPAATGSPPARYAWLAIYTIAGFMVVLGCLALVRSYRK